MFCLVLCHNITDLLDNGDHKNIGRHLIGDHLFPIREAAKKKTGFFWEISPKCGWVGWLTPKQGPNPSKPPPNCPENRLFRPKFHLSFSQISQKPWGGWVGKQIWERSPKKNQFFFFGSSPEQMTSFVWNTYKISDTLQAPLQGIFKCKIVHIMYYLKKQDRKTQ